MRKFKMLDRVRVGGDSRFPHIEPYEAIINGDNNADISCYGVYEIRDGKVSNQSAWLHEEILTLIPSDIEDNHEMISQYLWGVE